MSKLILFLFISTSSYISLFAQVNINQQIDSTISRASLYLSDTNPDLDFGSYALIHFCNLKYGVQMPEYEKHAFSRIQKVYKGKENEWINFKRLIDKKAKPLRWKDIKNTQSSIDSITLQALWSDKLKINKTDYYKSLKNLSEQGSYELTHALLACVWLEENNVTNTQIDADFALLKFSLIDKINHQILTNVKFWSDLEIEAVALLLYANEKKLVKPEYIQSIIHSQKADGGWVYSEAVDSSSLPHTTSLAIWALLQYSHQPLSADTWIQFKKKRK